MGRIGTKIVGGGVEESHHYIAFPTLVSIFTPEPAVCCACSGPNACMPLFCAIQKKSGSASSLSLAAPPELASGIGTGGSRLQGAAGSTK